MEKRKVAVHSGLELEALHKASFEVGKCYESLFDPGFVVKCTSLKGNRDICFTGEVILQNGEQYPSAIEDDCWVYSSFTEYKGDLL